MWNFGHQHDLDSIPLVGTTWVIDSCLCVYLSLPPLVFLPLYLCQRSAFLSFHRSVAWSGCVSPSLIACQLEHVAALSSLPL